jgi:DNA-directed RNA polymerase subunit RPC12/RpoP
MACIVHKWNGCKCTVCNASRDKYHLWNGCTCSQCGKHRDYEHLWDGFKCSICGKKQLISDDSDMLKYVQAAFGKNEFSFRSSIGSIEEYLSSYYIEQYKENSGITYWITPASHLAAIRLLDMLVEKGVMKKRAEEINEYGDQDYFYTCL